MTGAWRSRLDGGDGAYTPTITVIMPVYNAAHFLGRSLPPLRDMLESGEISEVICVDDGSTDRSAAMAERLGARVISSGGRMGPGGARNVAAAEAVGDILWFVDSDVVVRVGAAERIRAAFADPRTAAVFGSYDDRPSAQNFGSQYKNLVHHHHHQTGRPEASTFWAGCGAVRRDMYLKVGGYDAERYRFPSIEDIELGYRIADAGGKIRLDRDLLCKHLKYWTVRELVRVDITRRAIPWARLIMERPEAVDDLNVSLSERLRAALAGMALLSVLAPAFGLAPLWTPFVAAAAVFFGNWRLFRTFQRARGLVFAVIALLFHQIYYLYSTAAYVGCWAEAQLGRLSGRGPPARAHPARPPILARGEPQA